MKQSVENLLRRLNLEEVGENLFDGENEPTSWGRLFGGFVAAQALSAACRTVDDTRLPHSLHAYFLRPGDSKKHVTYAVDRIRDGKSFTTRRIVASQGERAIFNMAVSFHVAQPGYAHQHPMPDVPQPESLLGYDDYIERVTPQLSDSGSKIRYLMERPIEARYQHVPSYLGGPLSDGPNAVWFRVSDEVPAEDQSMHRCLLTYASDLSLLDNAVRPHGRNGRLGSLQLASLDHALWFHTREINVNDWLLYYQDSPAARDARGFTRGSIYTRDGILVASVAQEALMRPENPPEDGTESPG